MLDEKDIGKYVIFLSRYHTVYWYGRIIGIEDDNDIFGKILVIDSPSCTRLTINCIIEYKLFEDEVEYKLSIP